MSNNEWETPQELFDGIESDLLTFDIDVCATAKI